MKLYAQVNKTVSFPVTVEFDVPDDLPTITEYGQTYVEVYETFMGMPNTRLLVSLEAAAKRGLVTMKEKT